MLFVCLPKILHKHCFQFHFEVKMASRETMLMQNFGVTDKEHYGMLWYFLECLAPRPHYSAPLCHWNAFTAKDLEYALRALRKQYLIIYSFIPDCFYSLFIWKSFYHLLLQEITISTFRVCVKDLPGMESQHDPVTVHYTVIGGNYSSQN